MAGSRYEYRSTCGIDFSHACDVAWPIPCVLCDVSRRSASATILSGSSQISDPLEIQPRADGFCGYLLCFLAYRHRGIDDKYWDDVRIYIGLRRRASHAPYSSTSFPPVQNTVGPIGSHSWHRLQLR